MWQSGLPAGEDFRPESSGGDVVILHWEVYSHKGDSTESTVVALHYNVFLSNLYCCVVSCTVYSVQSTPMYTAALLGGLRTV